MTSVKVIGEDKIVVVAPWPEVSETYLGESQEDSSFSRFSSRLANWNLTVSKSKGESSSVVKIEGSTANWASLTDYPDSIESTRLAKFIKSELASR
jgi:hypothetical protein